MHAISFIQDLAVIMLVAGVVTILFHHFKQPVVLGYIVAGFIIGPHTPPFGLIHERTLQINAQGNQIRGNDRLVQQDGSDPPVNLQTMAVVRFHIHPQIDIREIDEHEVRLVAPDGEAWVLSTSDTDIKIEDDVFFADPSGVRASRQLTLTMPLGETPEVQWSLVRRR